MNGHAVWRMESFGDDEETAAAEEGGFMFARGSGGSSMQHGVNVNT